MSKKLPRTCWTCAFLTDSAADDPCASCLKADGKPNFKQAFDCRDGLPEPCAECENREKSLYVEPCYSCMLKLLNIEVEQS